MFVCGAPESYTSTAIDRPRAGEPNRLCDQTVRYHRAPCPRETRSCRSPAGCAPCWSESRWRRSRPRSAATRSTAGPRSSPAPASASIDTHGKHLFLRWDNGLTIHSHLRMSGRWRIFERPLRRRARAPAPRGSCSRPPVHTVVQFRGPILELIRDSRLGYDPYLRRLGPDILAEELDWPAILMRLRSDDPTRPVADALLDQRTLAGIGNLWKNESLYSVPDRPVAPDVRRQRRGPRAGRPHGARHDAARGAPRRPPVRRRGVRAGRQAVPPLRRRGSACTGQWDENRMTYWCPTCQT